MSFVSVHDVICLDYRDAGILAFGVVCSWVALYLWATRDRDR